MTLVIYSGLPDPVWFVHSRHWSFKEMKEHLDNARDKNTTYRHEHIPSILGYRGSLLSGSPARRAARLDHRPGDEGSTAPIASQHARRVEVRCLAPEGLPGDQIGSCLSRRCPFKRLCSWRATKILYIQT